MLKIGLNTDYVRSWSGILKILQLVIGTIGVGLIGNVFSTFILYRVTSLNFFLIASSSFYIGTIILFASYMASPSAASIVPNTVYELFYNSIATVLLIAASITLMVKITEGPKIPPYNELLVASICGLINSVLYLGSSVIAFSTYRDD